MDGSIRGRLASRGPAHTCFLPIAGEGSDMKANLKTPILSVLAAAMTCALPLVAGATDQGDTDRHYSNNFAPISRRCRILSISSVS